MQTRLMAQMAFQDAYEEAWTKIKAELIEDGYAEDVAEQEATYIAREAAMNVNEAAVYY